MSARSRLVFESGRPIAQVARDLGVHKEALRHWVRQAEADAGERRDRLTSGEGERLKALEREVRELRKANEILSLKAASVFFAKELAAQAREPGTGGLGFALGAWGSASVGGRDYRAPVAAWLLGVGLLGPLWRARATRRRRRGACSIA